MIYLRHENDKMVKYEVEYDIEKLKNLRYEIVKLCGSREYVAYETDYSAMYHNLYNENSNETKAGKKEYFGETRTVYHAEYNLIHEPMLSILIKNFIQKEDYTLIDYILENKEFKKEVIENDKKKKLLRELKEYISENMDYDRLRNMINQLERIPDVDNSNLENQNKYFDLVKKEIRLTKVEEIDYEAFNKAIEFVKIIKK